MSIKSDLYWLWRDKYHWSVAKLAGFEKQISKLSVAKWLEQYSASLSAAEKQDAVRLAKGEPIAYVVGWADFLGCRIDLQYRPLIPRVETEWWVEQLIGKSLLNANSHCLDLCCGSGCIGIALLKKTPVKKVDFVDISETAIRQTQFNLDLNAIKPFRYQLWQSDLFSNLPKKRYDLIVCNPPYIDPALPKSDQLALEPAQALYAADHGLAVIEAILAQVADWLTDSGQLWLEIGADQGAAVIKLAARSKLTGKIIPDQFGRERVLVARQ